MNRNVLIGVVVLLVIVLGVIAGVFFIGQDTDIREEASVPEGDAIVTLDPASATLSPGQPTTVSVLFNPSSISISGVSVRLTFAYSETSTPITASNIAVSSTLLGSGEWNCPVTDFTAEGGTANVDISCFNTSANGFTAGVDTLLATFDLTASETPEINPIFMSFDPNQSIIASVRTGEDVLLIPQATGNYRVSGLATNTFPDTTNETGTPSATTTTTTTAKTPTPSAAPVATLPDAGIGTPAIVGLGAGIVLLLGSFLIAI